MSSSSELRRDRDFVRLLCLPSVLVIILVWSSSSSDLPIKNSQIHVHTRPKQSEWRRELSRSSHERFRRANVFSSRFSSLTPSCSWASWRRWARLPVCVQRTSYTECRIRSTRFWLKFARRWTSSALRASVERERGLTRSMATSIDWRKN